MEPEILLLTDSRLSSDARVCGLFIASKPDEWNEIERDDFRRLLGGAGKERVVNALAELELWKYIERRNGGRGHSDAFRFSVRETLTLSDSVPETLTLNADSVRKTLTLNGAPTTTPTTTPSTPTKRGREQVQERARPPDIDLARLRSHLGEHADALDMMIDSADHPTNWAAAVWGKYGPTGTQLTVMREIPPERWGAVLSAALTDWATIGKAFEAKHFDGFVKKAASDERKNRSGPERTQRTAQSPTRGATGTDGKPGHRSGWKYE